MFQRYLDTKSYFMNITMGDNENLRSGKEFKEMKDGNIHKSESKKEKFAKVNQKQENPQQ